MRIRQDILVAVLRQKGLSDAEISEILDKVSVTQSKASHSRRARLVRAEKLDEATMERFRQQLLLREWERHLRKQDRLIQATGVMISATRSVAVFRHDDTILLAELRHSVGKRTPYTRRLLAQRLPQIKTEKCELVRLVVSTPQRTSVLTVYGQQRGVPLPEKERQWLLRSLSGTVVVRCGEKWRVELPKHDWRQIVLSWRQKYQLIEQRWNRLEISADGENWFKVSQLLH